MFGVLVLGAMAHAAEVPRHWFPAEVGSYGAVGGGEANMVPLGVNVGISTQVAGDEGARPNLCIDWPVSVSLFYSFQSVLIGSYAGARYILTPEERVSLFGTAHLGYSASFHAIGDIEGFSTTGAGGGGVDLRLGGGLQITDRDDPTTRWTLNARLILPAYKMAHSSGDFRVAGLMLSVGKSYGVYGLFQGR